MLGFPLCDLNSELNHYKTVDKVHNSPHPLPPDVVGAFIYVLMTRTIGLAVPHPKWNQQDSGDKYEN